MTTTIYTRPSAFALLAGVLLYSLCADAHARFSDERFDSPFKAMTALSSQQMTSNRSSQVPTDEIPQLVFPDNATTVYCPGSTLVLRWRELSNMTSFFVEVASDAAFTKKVLQTVVQFDTTVRCPINEKSGVYYWRISTGTTVSETRTFTTQFASQVQLALRYNGATLPSDKVVFQWYRDPAAASYSLELLSPSLESHIISSADTTVTVTVPREELVRWHVQSVCTSGVGIWSDKDSLIVAKEINEVRVGESSPSITGYPNPVTTWFNLQLPDGDNSSITLKLVDVVGVSIPVPYTVTLNLLRLSVIDVPSGGYNVIVRRNQEIFQSRILIVR